MRKTSIFILGIALALALYVGPLRASEEEAYPELDLWDLLQSIVEHPDPIPQIHYAKLDLDPASPDARTPGERADGRPDFDFDRATELPYVTWAYDTGRDRDIAFNVGTAMGWDPKIEFLTSSPADELDPRMHVDSYNNISLVWWEQGDGERIQLLRRDPVRGWTLPIEVASGRRPSVSMYQGDLLIAFERDRRGGGQEIVFGQSRMGEPFTFEVIASVPTNRRLDPVVHARGGELWVDWKHDDDTLAFTRYTMGDWGSMQLRPWTDPSWIGEAAARHQIEVELTR